MARPPSIPRDILIAETRGLLMGGRAGLLSTTFRGKERWPYGSLVTYAPDTDGSPIFLFSGLSDHTANLAKDPKACLLVERALRRKHPQQGPRISVLGTVKATKEARHRARFLARHPGAARYADFGDFGFYVMTVRRVHLVGGFARAQWLKADEVAPPPAAAGAVAEAEAGVIAHMNADHAEALDLYANRLLGRKGAGWRAVACDPWGLDLMRNDAPARLEFDGMAADAGDLRARLVSLAARAREKARG
ncbi:MAG: heme iron utilization protein [Rhodospirillales bacterium CG15_BIG_FIL_POST_REV_8_21_14_020_66_15]|nr:MAG: heme iron utilization protein [Rhodospirillales bacterium CG15_BIG_FIL_POST_REV_8_21_14_020_66_15]